MSSVRSLKNKSKNNIFMSNSFMSELLRNKFLYLLALPGILFFFIFNYLPIAGLLLAFQDFNPIKGIFGSEFVGLKNFEFFFTSKDWILVTFNTLFLNTLFIVIGIFFQILMSIGLTEISNRPFKKVAQTLMFLPNFISWAVVATFSIALFSTDEGVINKVLESIGAQPINFYQNAAVWPVLLVLLRLWKGTGFGTVVYMATIASIDSEMYEAAKIDGATRFQTIMFITLPMLKPTTIMLFVLAIGQIFYGDFGMIYALVGDNPMVRDTTDVIDTFVYRALRKDNDIGMSSAIGLYQSVVGLFMVIGANKLVKKFERDSALF